MRDNQRFLVDTNGTEYPIGDFYAPSFSEGYAVAVNQNHRKGYIDTSGRIVFPFENHDCKDFSEGYGCIQSAVRGSGYGFVNKQFDISIPLIYNDAKSFSDGLAVVQKIDADNNYLWGAIDCSGNVIIPFEYEALDNFSEGFSKIEKDFKYGFINKSNQVIIPFNYDDAREFHEGLAVVKKGEGWGFVDTNGKCTFDY